MYTLEEKSVIDLSDGYTLMYSYIAQALIHQFKEEGERAVREAIRRYGRDRALVMRKKHLDVGAKINFEHLFSLYGDLPSDPRYVRQRTCLTPTERVDRTLVCPMADTWKAHGHISLGRIYCEEFHSACFGTYPFGYGRVNLAHTLTQDGDDCCTFNIILRPGDMPQEIRKQCFEEFDPEYVKPKFPVRPTNGKDGFQQLSIKLYYYLVECADEIIGTPSKAAIQEGLRQFAQVSGQILLDTAQEYALEITSDFIQLHTPISPDCENHADAWNGYSGHDALQLWKDNFNSIFYSIIKNK